MQVAKTNFLPKSNINLTSAVRQASCSRGWLRIMTQYIFFAITVTSFILIVMMSMPTAVKVDSNKSSRCTEQNCRIICKETMYNNHEEEILEIISETELFCQRVTLILQYPTFKNGTMPIHWMSRIRSKVYKILVFRGNLRYITPGAFMSQFAGNIEVIGFKYVTLTNWKADTLVGLSNLREIYVKDCKIIDAERNSLQAVDDTLEELVIYQSGSWNPAHFTGATDLERLYTVDFSFNNFGNVIGNESFTGLKKVKILFLNSCNITAIGAGAFDSLLTIEVIYLNNNFLVTIPSGLFDGMKNRINPRPRINLLNNPWDCACDLHDLRSLYTNGLLYVEPTCKTPPELHGKTFSAFDKYCQNNSSYEEVIVVDLFKPQNSSSFDFGFSKIIENDRCGDSYLGDSSIQLITPDTPYSCHVNLTAKNSLSLSYLRNRCNKDITESDWIKPTFLIKTSSYSMVQLGSSIVDDYGLLWYRTSCPEEIFCVNTLPKILRLYHIDFKSNYTFCPIELRSLMLKEDMCVNFDLLSKEGTTVYYANGSIALYFCTGLVCLAVGATLVYGMIRYNPVLLKGSKRLLFVKHKNVDALVLPPKVPLRNSLSCQASDPNLAKISLSENKNMLSPRNFMRMKSTRSDKSTVSYISALQPTEDQLAEWRERRHFDNNLTITSMNSELSMFSWVNEDSSSCSPDIISTCTVPYESMK